jgi:hypothetical protein
MMNNNKINEIAIWIARILLYYWFPFPLFLRNILLYNTLLMWYLLSSYVTKLYYVTYLFLCKL